jgi:hypothetical protein
METKYEMMDIEERIALLEIQNHTEKMELVSELKNVLSEVQPSQLFHIAINQMLHSPLLKKTMLDLGIKILLGMFNKKH